MVECKCGNELVKWIRGYEGSYAVTTLGHIISFKWSEPRIVAQANHNAGYMYTTLNGANVLIHRVVAESFIPNAEAKKYVNHKNGNKKDNAVENLEWCTASENVIHAYKNKLNPHTKKVVQYSLDGNKLVVYSSIEEAQTAIGAPGKKNIWCAINLERCKTAYGYIWRYLNEEVGIVQSIKPNKV